MGQADATGSTAPPGRTDRKWKGAVGRPQTDEKVLAFVEYMSGQAIYERRVDRIDLIELFD